MTVDERLSLGWKLISAMGNVAKAIEDIPDKALVRNAEDRDFVSERIFSLFPNPAKITFPESKQRGLSKAEGEAAIRPTARYGVYVNVD